MIVTGGLRAAQLDAMNFLNEIVMAYPQAISFGPGRPHESAAEVRMALEQVAGYAAAVGGADGAERFIARLGQYGETNGMIREEIAAYLQRDEGIHASPADILVTVGCQEAMLLLLMTLFESDRDVLLVADPAYVGITGPASMLGIKVWPVPHGIGGLDPEEVASAASAVRAMGLRPRALYHVPTYNNPLGTLMTASARRRLLEVASTHEMLIFEDNAYGAFSYEGAPPPTLASMDDDGRVFYLGSFAKTLFPGLRVGYLVYRGHASNPDIMRALGRAKSFTTVNTSPLVQAIVGGILRSHDYSLRSIVDPKRRRYQAQRDQMLASLASHLGGGATQTTWNRPDGGFFLALTLPFDFRDEDLRVCALKYGVVCAPMHYFTLTDGWKNVVRLSFSYVSTEQIERGIASLAQFITDHDQS